RPWLCRTACPGHVPLWLSARQARASGGRSGPLRQQYGYLAGHAEWGCPGLTPGPTGGVVSLYRPARDGSASVGRGDGRGHRGTVGCLGALSYSGRAAPAAPRPGRPAGRELFSASPSPGSLPTGEDARTACSPVLESHLATTGQAHRSPPALSTRL